MSYSKLKAFKDYVEVNGDVTAVELSFLNDCSKLNPALTRGEFMLMVRLYEQLVNRITKDIPSEDLE